MLCRIEAAFDPDLGGAVILPVREQADAVATEKYLFEVIFKLRKGEVFIDDLCDLKGGLDIESGFGDDADGSEIDDSAKEVVAIFGSGEGLK